MCSGEQTGRASESVARKAPCIFAFSRYGYPRYLSEAKIMYSLTVYLRYVHLRDALAACARSHRVPADLDLAPALPPPPNAANQPSPPSANQPSPPSHTYRLVLQPPAPGVRTVRAARERNER